MARGTPVVQRLLCPCGEIGVAFRRHSCRSGNRRPTFGTRLDAGQVDAHRRDDQATGVAQVSRRNGEGPCRLVEHRHIPLQRHGGRCRRTGIRRQFRIRPRRSDGDKIGGGSSREPSNSEVGLHPARRVGVCCRGRHALSERLDDHPRRKNPDRRRDHRFLPDGIRHRTRWGAVESSCLGADRNAGPRRSVP